MGIICLHLCLSFGFHHDDLAPKRLSEQRDDVVDQTTTQNQADVSTYSERSSPPKS